MLREFLRFLENENRHKHRANQAISYMENSVDSIVRSQQEEIQRLKSWMTAKGYWEEYQTDMLNKMRIERQERILRVETSHSDFDRNYGSERYE